LAMGLMSGVGCVPGGGGGGGPCTPGTQAQCPCPGGGTGVQACDGNGVYGACACGQSPQGGRDGTGGQSVPPLGGGDPPLGGGAGGGQPPAGGGAGGGQPPAGGGAGGEPPAGGQPPAGGGAGGGAGGQPPVGGGAGGDPPVGGGPCQPACGDRECGDDDCGGSCGNCLNGACNQGRCACPDDDWVCRCEELGLDDNLTCVGDNLVICRGPDSFMWADCEELAGGECAEGVLDAGQSAGCLVPEGGQCHYTLEDESNLYFPCGRNGVVDPGMGCVFGGNCVRAISECETDNFEPLCEGPVAHLAAVCNAFSAEVSQSLFVDCGEEGLAGECANGACIAVSGGQCGERIFHCPEGEVCEGESEESWGACNPAE
jgi:hypothetical protein